MGYVPSYATRILRCSAIVMPNNKENTEVRKCGKRQFTRSILSKCAQWESQLPLIKALNYYGRINS